MTRQGQLTYNFVALAFRLKTFWPHFTVGLLLITHGPQRMVDTFAPVLDTPRLLEFPCLDQLVCVGI